MKSYGFKLEYTRYTKSGKREIKVEKDIHLDNDTTLGDIEEWLRALKNAVAEAVQATKRGDDIRMEITRSTYKNWRDPDKKLVQLNFDRWTTEFVEGGQDGEGIYFLADKRYTDEHWDLYLKAKTLRDDIKNI